MLLLYEGEAPLSYTHLQSFWLWSSETNVDYYQPHEYMQRCSYSDQIETILKLTKHNFKPNWYLQVSLNDIRCQ